MRRNILLLVLCGAVLGLGGAALLICGRMAGCAYVPLLADELLRNASLLPGESPWMPRGWTAATTNGVALHGPTFVWATEQNGWPDDTWKSTPWFSKDPHGTIQSDPGWYFGDLMPALQREHQDIQSHTFSHFYGGYADAEAWRADLAAWRDVAAERGVPSARSLAFPWSSSAGMSYAKEISANDQPLKFTITNSSSRDLDRLTLSLPFAIGRVTLNGVEMDARLSRPGAFMVNIMAGQTVEVQAWPA